MDGTFVKAIQELVRPATYEVEGVTFDAGKGVPLAMPGASPMSTTTLASLRDYMRGNLDGLDPKNVVALIADPNSVVLLSKLDPLYRKREAYAKATVVAGRFQFGQFIESEEFIIQLQSLFSDTTDRAKILQVVGNLSDGTVRNTADDGVTQTVNTQVGITQRAEMKVPNPVTLVPYRTFSDVEQPASKFVFRMASGSRRGGESVSCALFEADNGAWRAQALSNIKEWLESNLPKGVTILS